MTTPTYIGGHKEKNEAWESSSLSTIFLLGKNCLIPLVRIKN